MSAHIWRSTVTLMQTTATNICIWCGTATLMQTTAMSIHGHEERADRLRPGAVHEGEDRADLPRIALPTWDPLAAKLWV